MKCPKCGYLGFEDVDRCRNCGYEFSLAARATPELTIRSGATPLDPLADLALVDEAASPQPDEPAPSSELPLFGGTAPAARDLARRRLTPRLPIAVRRAAVDEPRRRAEENRLQLLDLDVDADADASAFHPERVEAPKAATPAPQPAENAGFVARTFAVIIDLLLLAAVDAAVVYFTLEICGISIDEIGLVPKAPLIAFLLVQNGGYLIAFTAGGQTIGKLIAGIKVIGENDTPLDLGRAARRTLMWALLAIPAGLGFLTALFSADRRGLHDRFADTRVVRA